MNNFVVYYRVFNHPVVTKYFNTENEALTFYDSLEKYNFKCLKCKKYVIFKEVFDNGW